MRFRREAFEVPSSSILATLLLSALGAQPLAAQVWDRGNQLVVSTYPVLGEGFGSVLATGDFDGDGIADLAVGSPRHDLGGATDNGAVEVRLGGAAGLSATYALAIQGGYAEQELGAALATGDFNHDGRDELVIGSPGFTFADPPGPHTGIVTVNSRGAGGGWSTTAWDQDSPGIGGAAEAEDRFGSALAVGNFNGDLYPDLAIGIPDEDIGSVVDAGAVEILYGSANGLTAAGSQIWFRSGGGIVGTAQTYAALGFALAAGNFDGDYYGDLAIGIPGDLLSGAGAQDGSVVILHGSASGLVADAQQRVDREILGDFDAGDFNSQFGAALAAGDLNPTWSCLDAETCADDLVVGARNAKVNGLLSAGLVYTLFGSWESGGLTLADRLEISQSFVGDSFPEAADRFGSVVAAGAFAPGPRRHFAVGTPAEARFDLAKSGVAQVALDVAPGYDTTNNLEAEFFEQRAGMASAPKTQNAGFGSALAFGDFNGDGWGDLAVGVDGYVVPGTGIAGGVQILFGALFADGFENGSYNGWYN